MDIPRALREELNALSKEVFGVPSKWQKLLKNGNTHVLTRTVKETVPGGNGGPDSVKEVQVPILTEHGAKQIVTTHYSLEEVHQMLLGYKVQLENFKAMAKQQQEEKAAAEAEHKALKDVHDTAYGSAVK